MFPFWFGCRHQLLPDDDLGPLYDLLIDEPPEIRHAILVISIGSWRSEEAKLTSIRISPIATSYARMSKEAKGSIAS